MTEMPDAFATGEGAAPKVEGFKKDKGPRIFRRWYEEEGYVVLIDDRPKMCARHRIYKKGMGKLRTTCVGANPNEHKKPVPQMCPGCNAGLSDRSIEREGFAYLTLVDERQFQYKGKSYQDMKSLLELDDADAKLFGKKCTAHEGLVGARFKVYRSEKKTSPPRGDSWIFDKKVNLVTHFWYSPAIEALHDSLKRRWKDGDPPVPDPRSPDGRKALVTMFIKPFDYDELIYKSDMDQMEMFLARAGQGMTTASGGGQASGGSYGGSGNSVPPPPDGAAPDYSTDAPETVPTNAVPTSAAPPPPPQDAGARPQPSVPDPAPGTAASVPPPPTGEAHPDRGSPAPPPPAEAAAIAAGASATVGDEYDFEGGFSSDEPF